MNRVFALLALAVLTAACSPSDNASETAAAAPTETAEEFIDRVNAEYKDWWRELNAAGWLRATYINEDSAVVDALANERYAAWHSAMVKDALQYEGQEMDAATRRGLDALKNGALMVAPDDDAKRKELASILTEMAGMYGAGQYCRGENDCLSGNELELLMNQTKDYDELLEYWVGWREIAPPMRDKYERFVELSNEGANEFGHDDLGSLWRSKYDMSPAEFEADTARLWEEVKPLYDELHCHVRAKLGEHYGPDKVPQDGPIPAHLLGNMWAQEWGFIYDLMEPYPGVSDL
ncbi:MAG: M2 family metallopeptidase, partial [Pseudomonadota bacterium]